MILLSEKTKMTPREWLNSSQPTLKALETLKVKPRKNNNTRLDMLHHLLKNGHRIELHNEDEDGEKQFLSLGKENKSVAEFKTKLDDFNKELQKKRNGERDAKGSLVVPPHPDFAEKKLPSITDLEKNHPDLHEKYQALMDHQFKGRGTKTYNVTDFAKSEYLGSKVHDVEERNRNRLNDALKEHRESTNSSGVTVNINGVLHHNVHSVIKSSRSGDDGSEPKSDFTLVDAHGQHIAHISHKGKTFQQYGGLSTKSLGEKGIDREKMDSGHPVVRKFYDRVRDMVGNKEHKDSNIIFQKLDHKDPEHQALANKLIFGKDHEIGSSTGVDNVDHVIHGELGFHKDEHGHLHIQAGHYAKKSKNSDVESFVHSGHILTNHHTVKTAENAKNSVTGKNNISQVVRHKDSVHMGADHALPAHHMPALIWRHGESSSFANHTDSSGNVHKLGGRVGGFRTPTSKRSLELVHTGGKLTHKYENQLTESMFGYSCDIEFANIDFNSCFEGFQSVEEIEDVVLISYYNNSSLEDFGKFESLVESYEDFYGKKCLKFSHIENGNAKVSKSLYAILETYKDTNASLRMIISKHCDVDLLESSFSKYKNVQVSIA